MNDANLQLFNLGERISSGKCNVEDTRKELERIESKFGKEQFVEYYPERKEKPWTQDYLKELEHLFHCGAGSKEFLLYMAEVSEEVYRSKRIRKAFLCILLLISAVAMAIVFYKAVLRG